MKKMLSILLAVVMTAALAGAVAVADEFPQPEGGKKFEGDWALGGGLIEINYEEEGYRVSVDMCNNDDWSGSIWEYSCYYVENNDTLMSISSSKRSYSTDPDTQERIDGEIEYEGLDEEGQETVFSFAENGTLIWSDGHDRDAGADLEFRSIGNFDGSWRSAEGEEPVWVYFSWEGLDQEKFSYFVYLHRGDDDVYSEFIMTGLFSEETGKLTCTGNSIDTEDKETYEAVFSMAEDGRLLYEAANGILLEYDFLGGCNG